MAQRTHTPENGLRIVYRCVALLLLAFTAVDLASHGECGEEWLGISPAALRLAATSGRGTSAPELRSTANEAESSSEEPAPVEDCFCCCSHLLVTPQFVLATPATEAAPITLADSRASNPPLAELDHPPRPA